MPYIKQERRKALQPILDLMAELHVGYWGDLNYILYKYAKDGCFSYSEFKSFRGELIEAHTEIGRRLLAPYEDLKIIENGDI